MIRNSSFRWKIILSGAVAFSIALLAGCSSNEGGAASSARDVSVPRFEATDAAAVTVPMDAKVSANNQHDLDESQPDTIITAAKRDLMPTPGGAGAALSYQALGDMLRQIDPQTEDKQAYYLLKTKFKSSDGVDWSYSISVSLSKDGSYVWLMCGFSPINADSNVLGNLLTANSLTGTAFFAVTDDQNKLLMLMDPFRNSALTPDLVLAELKNYLTKIENAEPLYKPITNVQQARRRRKHPKSLPIKTSQSLTTERTSHESQHDISTRNRLLRGDRFFNVSAGRLRRQQEQRRRGRQG